MSLLDIFRAKPQPIEIVQSAVVVTSKGGRAAQRLARVTLALESDPNNSALIAERDALTEAINGN